MPLRRWSEVAGRWGAPAAEVTATGGRLRRRYAEPHRRYHTLSHVVAVLDALFLDLADHPDEVTLAAWYHDAVYDPTSPGGRNEEASATLAGEELGALGAPPAVTACVARLVRSTAAHLADDADSAVLNDADLSILGAPGAAYTAYTTAVRDEYGSLDDAAWRAGRSAVLERLLAREHLFATGRGRERWEASARRNLAAELAALAAQP